MKYFEECNEEETVFTLPICRECEKEIKPGDKVYTRTSQTYLCYECGQIEVSQEA
jgi:hypothetical protein